MASCAPDKKPVPEGTPAGAETVREFTITRRDGLNYTAAKELAKLSGLAAPEKSGFRVNFSIGDHTVDPRDATGNQTNDGVFSLLSLAGGRDSKVQVTISGLDNNTAADYMDKVEQVLAPKK